AVLVRGVGSALVDHAGGAVGERAVHAIGVAGDPADVGGAPVDVLAGLVVEHDVVRVGRLREVAARGVDDALGLAGGAGGVEDEQGVLGVERLRCVVGGLLGDDLVPPDVAVVLPVHVDPGAAHHEDLLDRLGGAGDAVEGVAERLVDAVLEGGGLAAAELAVGGDDDLGLGVI